MDTGIAFAAVTTRNEGVRVTGKLGFSGHPMLEHFKFVAAHTKRTPKITIPAPSAIYGRPVRDADRQGDLSAHGRFFDDLGQAYREGRARLRRCRLPLPAARRSVHRHAVRSEISPADERRAATIRKSSALLYGDLINTAMSDIPSDMTITMHLCRGNYKSTFMGAGGYDAVQEILFNQIKVHGYFMEYDTERAGGFEPLRIGAEGHDAWCSASSPPRAAGSKSKDEIKRRIERGREISSILDQLCLSPQCGFASTEEGNILAEDEQWAKLRMIVEVAEEVWGKS